MKHSYSQCTVNGVTLQRYGLRMEYLGIVPSTAKKFDILINLNQHISQRNSVSGIQTKVLNFSFFLVTMHVTAWNVIMEDNKITGQGLQMRAIYHY